MVVDDNIDIRVRISSDKELIRKFYVLLSNLK
jgi:hypothetical protein